MSSKRGKEFDEDEYDELKRRQYREAFESYEKRMGDRTNRDNKH